MNFAVQRANNLTVATLLKKCPLSTETESQSAHRVHRSEALYVGLSQRAPLRILIFKGHFHFIPFIIRASDEKYLLFPTYPLIRSHQQSLVKNTKYEASLLSAFFCYFISESSIYHPQHFVFRRLKFIFVIWDCKPSFTLIHSNIQSGKNKIKIS
jgi:hypothetical protein